MFIKLDSCSLFWQHIAHHGTWQREISVKLSFIDYLLTESQLWHLSSCTVWFFPPLFSFDNHMEFTMTRPDDVVEYISFVLFPQRNFSWFISYSSSTEGRTGFICEEIVFFVMLLERPYSVCTWPSMSVNVSTIHCQFFVKVNHCSFFETLTNCSWKLWKIVLFSKQNCYMNLCLKTNKLHL